MNRWNDFLRLFCIIMICILLPVFAEAGTGKGWKKNYRPKDNSEEELFKACAYGKIKSCYNYHKLYIAGQKEELK